MALTTPYKNSCLIKAHSVLNSNERKNLPLFQYMWSVYSQKKALNQTVVCIFLMVVEWALSSYRAFQKDAPGNGVFFSFCFPSAVILLTKKHNFPEQYEHTLKAFCIGRLQIFMLGLSVFMWVTVKAGPDKIVKRFHCYLVFPFHLPNLCTSSRLMFQVTESSVVGAFIWQL